MEGECLVAVDLTLEPESRNEATQQSVKAGGSTPKLKSTAALLVLTLCLASAAAALLFFNNHSNKGPQQEDDFDLRHTLRQISESKSEREVVRAAIHLEGEYSQELNSLQWKANVDQYHAQGGLTLRNNKIIIPRSGLYFVYSQASFRVRCSSRAQDGDDDATSQPKIHLSHTVKRWSSTYGYPEESNKYQTILHSIRTACQRTVSDNAEEEGRWFSSVYMGAVFNLMEGDQLKAEPERRLLPDLEDEAGKTFFGVFAL